MRNPEYAFLELDSAEKETELTRRFEALTGETVRPASREKLIIRWLALMLTQERARMNVAINQNIPSRAEGEHLDALGELFYQQERTQAHPAVCTVRFRISEERDADVDIPAGTRVTDEGRTLYWKTVERAAVRAGETYVDVAAECMTPGSQGNGWLPGQICRAVDIFDYYSGCENIDESKWGDDVLSDEEYYQLMRLSMDALSPAGPAGSYIYKAKAASSEIADVAVSSPKPGEVHIFAMMKDGSVAGEDMKAYILSKVNASSVRPLTDLVVMDDPEEVGYEVDLTWYAPSASEGENGELEEKVARAVEEYVTWQGSRMGRDINPSKLISMVMAAGCKRVEVRSPQYTKLRDGKNPILGGELLEMPQVARVSGVRVVNGGTEDE